MTRKVSRRHDDNGFTLIELLIVIVVLGVLSAIVLFAVGSARDDAVASSCIAERKTIETAQEAHKATTGAYATGFAALVGDGFNGFLRDQPAQFTMTGDGTSYSLTPVLPCTDTNSGPPGGGPGGDGGPGGGGPGGSQAQTITFDSPAPTGAVVGGSYEPDSTASSGLAVAYAGSGACSGATTINFDAAGTCTVTATQSGDDDWLAADPINQTFEITQPVAAPTYAGGAGLSCGGPCYEGSTVTTSNGTWGGSAATFTYEWQTRGASSCSSGGSWTNRSGGQTLALPSANGTDTVRVRVTATNSAGQAQSGYVCTTFQETEAPDYDEDASISVNGNTSATVDRGDWDGVPAPTFTYQWSTRNSGSCSSGGGWTDAGTGTTISINSSIQYIRVTITGTNSQGSDSVTICRSD